jgi:hypothetical protein
VSIIVIHVAEDAKSEMLKLFQVGSNSVFLTYLHTPYVSFNLVYSYPDWSFFAKNVFYVLSFFMFYLISGIVSHTPLRRRGRESRGTSNTHILIHTY